jgi:hypothetical protein
VCAATFSVSALLLVIIPLVNPNADKALQASQQLMQLMSYDA